MCEQCEDTGLVENGCCTPEYCRCHLGVERRLSDERRQIPRRQRRRAERQVVNWPRRGVEMK